MSGLTIREQLQTIFAAIATHQGFENTSLRLLKVGEEFGEAIEEYINANGANLRKSKYVLSSTDAIAKELCDVLIAAFVSLHDFTGDPVGLFEKRLQYITERVAKEGS